MKTPKEWLDIFTGQERTYGPDAAEVNIKAIQDEAFQEGINSTMRLLAANASPATCGEISRILGFPSAERDKLP